MAVLRRKVTVLGSTSLVVVIPRQLADILGIDKGSFVGIELMENKALKLFKLEEARASS
jgi:antitoxin component of MazEF toxin-antitoxin module